MEQVYKSVNNVNINETTEINKNNINEKNERVRLTIYAKVQI